VFEIAKFALARAQNALARHRAASTWFGKRVALLQAALWNLLRRVSDPRSSWTRSWRRACRALLARPLP
jgi:hypothetical protein